MVMATNDAALMFVHRFSRIFSHHICAVPDAVSASWALDKGQTIRLAERLGLPIPKTWFPEEFDSVERLAEEVTYPCVVKPRQSRYWTSEGQLASGGPVIFCSGYRDLVKAVKRSNSTRFLVQEFVQGEGRGIYLLTEHGKSRLMFAHRRVREGDPRGSGASCAESTPVDPVLGEISQALLREVKWHGVAMVEFKVGDKPYIMEINGRFWNSLPLSVQAGCDFPWHLFRMFTGQPFSESPGYEVGLRSRSLSGDLLHLLHVLRGRPQGWTGPYPTRSSALFGVARGVLPDIRSYTFELDDPIPGLMELYCWIASKPTG